MKQTNNIFLVFILAIVSSVLISTFVIEYWLDYKPCTLCLYERIPYIFSILLIIKILFFKKYGKITLLTLSLVFVSSTVLAFYHFGIEEGFFNEFAACNIEEQSKNLSKEQLIEQLDENRVSCKDVNFRILGLSLATINTILSFFLSVIFLRLFFKYGKN